MYTFVYISHPVTSAFFLLPSSFKALPLLSSAAATQTARKAHSFLCTIPDQPSPPPPPHSLRPATNLHDWGCKVQLEVTISDSKSPSNPPWLPTSLPGAMPKAVGSASCYSTQTAILSQSLQLLGSLNSLTCTTSSSQCLPLSSLKSLMARAA